MKDSHTVIEMPGSAMDESLMRDLGQLRIRVFREYPYLYDGDEEYEREYLNRYREARDSLVVLILDGAGEPVGATTSLPMSEEGPEFREPFENAGLDVREVFYFGESVLLPAWRGQGIGKLFFDRREAHARELGYRITAFCAVERPPDHPKRPDGYRPLDGFWSQRGYRKHEGLLASFPWKELGEDEETPHALGFWLKHWPALPTPPTR